MFPPIIYNVAIGRASLSIKPKSNENNYNCLTLRPRIGHELREKDFHFSQGIMS